MLGKGLESLIPSGGYKPQPNGGQGLQDDGRAQPVPPVYYPVPAAALYEAGEQQSGYYQPPAASFVGSEPQAQPVSSPSYEVAQKPPAYYDYTAPIAAHQAVAPAVPPAFVPPASINGFPEGASYQPQSSPAYQPPATPEEIRPAIPSYNGFAVTEKEREIVPAYGREDLGPAPEAAGEDYSKNGGTVYQIDVSKIFPNPHQPRRYFDDAALNDLANSIREFGIIQPLVVTKIESQTGPTYQLIAGERRLMAAKRVGLKTVPAVIKSVAMDRERLELAIIENIQRENLNPLEAARSYARLQDEFNLTQREIAGRMGKSRETIANTLRLLNLPTEVQQALEEGRINESHARLLLQVDDIAKQREMFSSILRFKPSVRELKAQLRRGSAAAGAAVRPAYSNPELLSLQARLEETLGTKVQINDEGDKGKITINYYSADELSDLISKLSRPWGY